jgi:hypothetical protein
LEARVIWKEWNILFVNDAKYFGVIFYINIARKIHIESIATKNFSNFIRIYPLLKSGRLSVNTKLSLYKALIRVMVNYICPALEFEGDSYLLELQRLQNKIHLTIGNLPRSTPTRDFHLAYKIPYVHDYVTKICRKQTEI